MIDTSRLARIDAALAAGEATRVVDDACALIDEDPASKDAQRAYLRVLLAWARVQTDLVDRVFPQPVRVRVRSKLPALYESQDLTARDVVLR